MAGQRVVPGERVPAETLVRLVSGVNFGMSLEIVSTNKALIAVVTLVLAITKVSLNVRLDILLSSKPPLTSWVQADPFSVLGVWAIDVRGDFLQRDTGLCNGCLDPGV